MSIICEVTIIFFLRSDILQALINYVILRVYMFLGKTDAWISIDHNKDDKRDEDFFFVSRLLYLREFNIK